MRSNQDLRGNQRSVFCHVIQEIDEEDFGPGAFDIMDVNRMLIEKMNADNRAKFVFFLVLSDGALDFF